MNKKKLLSLALVVVLIATISFGTLAWFNDKDEVKNTFYVASSDGPVSPDDIFSVDVKEYIDDDGNGEFDKDPVDGGHNFEDIVPGQKIAKKPIITNTGHFYDQWIRVTITFARKEAWEAMNSDPINLLTLADGANDNWEFGALDTSGDAFVYTYYLKYALKPGDSVETFTHVNIPTTLDQHDMAPFSGQELTLTVVADAIQYELGTSAQAAFAAYTPAP